MGLLASAINVEISDIDRLDLEDLVHNTDI